MKHALARRRRRRRRLQQQQQAAGTCRSVRGGIRQRAGRGAAGSAAAAREASVDPYLVLSVIRQESFFNEDAVSRAGAIGLMQIMPETGRRLARSLGMGPFDRKQLFNPLQSIRMGSYFLAGQVRDFMEGPTRAVGFELGLAAYNAGPHVARKWVDRFPFEDPDIFVERIPYRETRLYVKKVLKNYTIYKSLAQA